MNRACFLLALSAALAGCSRPTATTTKSEGGRTEGPKADPWEAAAKRLRKDTDVPACRAALSQLNSDLANRPDVPGPAGLTPDAEKALAAVVPLNPGDLAEVKPASFSNLDPVYLADCLYLRDAVKSMLPASAPPDRAARIAFDWVCRQVYLNPWLRVNQNGQLEGTAVPPAYVLRRGYGSGLERAYVFLAVLQQLGIDGCLVGPPSAATQFATYVPYASDKKTPLTGSPRGPFWAVGARVGDQVLLFDPWRGQPFPNTLAQIKTDQGLLNPWFDVKTPEWGVTRDEVKDAAVFLAVPVSGLAPRLAALEEKLRPDSGVRLAVNAAALRDRFLAEAVKGPAFPTPEVKFWNPPTDRFAYGRVLAAFLPIEEGGIDRAEADGRILRQYQLSLMPASVLALPAEVTELGVRERLVVAAAATYDRAFFTPPSPRERIHRGQFQEAARYIAGRQDSFQKGIDRLRNSRDAAQVADFAKVSNRVHADLSRARSFDPAAVPAAQAAVNDFWNRYAPIAQLVVDQASARAGLLEASFLLATCKHEEAERLQARRELAAGPEADRLRADAAGAWREAANAWESYADQTGTDDAAGFPGRAEHVKALSDRAKALRDAK